MEYTVNVDLWRRGNLRRGEVVDLDPKEAKRYLDSGILVSGAGVVNDSTASKVAQQSTADPEPATPSTNEVKKPNRSAPLNDWVTYAQNLGHSTKGLTKAELIRLTSA